MENRRRWRPTQNEFQESDVWDVITTSRKPSEPEQPSISLLSRQLRTAARMIPRAKNLTHEPRLVQHSAPVNIPDWSKVYGKSPRGNSSRSSSSADQDCSYDDYHDSDDVENNDDDDDDDDVDQRCRLPPHVWLAKKHTRSEISSFSMCEGAGRTLKGKDLSRVRHAVLTITGFI